MWSELTHSHSASLRRKNIKQKCHVSMSDAAGERCPICLEAMGTSGDHQITSLTCGHMFGFQCIAQWLRDPSSASKCPTCRRYCDQDKMRRLIWDGSVPIDNQYLEELRRRKEDLITSNRSLLRQVGERERDLNICNGELARSRRKPLNAKRSRIISKPVARAGLLLEKQLKNARKMCLTPKLIIVARDGDRNMEYGVEVWEIENLSTSKFIPIHQAPISDICVSPFDQQTISTVGIDKRVVVTSLRTGQATLDCSFSNALMACEWVEHSTVAVGGAGGKLRLVDGRGKVAHESILGKGPPIMALCRLSDAILLVSTPIVSRLFNFVKLQFENGEYIGATSVRSTSDGDVIMMCRSDGAASIAIGKFCANNGFTLTHMIPLQGCETRVSPGILRMMKKVFFALPKEAKCDIELITLEHKDCDIWSDSGRMFLSTSHPTPVIDVCMVHHVDFIVVSLSSHLVKVFALPIESLV